MTSTLQDSNADTTLTSKSPKSALKLNANASSFVPAPFVPSVAAPPFLPYPAAYPMYPYSTPIFYPPQPTASTSGKFAQPIANTTSNTTANTPATSKSTSNVANSPSVVKSPKKILEIKKPEEVENSNSTPSTPSTPSTNISSNTSEDVPQPTEDHLEKKDQNDTKSIAQKDAMLESKDEKNIPEEANLSELIPRLTYSKEFILSLREANTLVPSITVSDVVEPYSGSDPFSTSGNVATNWSIDSKQVLKRQTGSSMQRGPGSNRRLGRYPASPAPAKPYLPVSVLHHTDNAWKSVAVNKQELDEDERTIRDINSILNKLTPEKFESLYGQIIDLNINSENILTALINRIFEKAISEPAFSNLYAQLCIKLGDKFNTLPSDPSATKNFFKKKLLNRCQTAFEEMENLEKTGNEEKRKKRLLGIVSFVGELYLSNIASTKLITTLLGTLLSTADSGIKTEANIESVHALLTKVGKMLDSKTQPDIAKIMDGTFANLKQKRSKESTLDLRHQFLILDLIELRQNKWVPRRVEEKAKRLDDVKNDVEKEDKAQREVGKRRIINRNSSPPRSPSQTKTDNEYSNSSVQSKSKPIYVQKKQTPIIKDRVSNDILVKNIDEPASKEACKQKIRSLDLTNTAHTSSELLKIAPPSFIVAELVSLAMDREIQLPHITKIFLHLCEKHNLNHTELTKGFQKTFSSISETLLDAPRGLEYFAQLIAPLIVNQFYSLSSLLKALSTLLPSSQYIASKALSILLQKIKSDPQSKENLSNMVKHSGVDWKKYFDTLAERKAMFKDYGLDELL